MLGGGMEALQQALGGARNLMLRVGLRFTYHFRWQKRPYHTCFVSVGQLPFTRSDSKLVCNTSSAEGYFHCLLPWDHLQAKGGVRQQRDAIALPCAASSARKNIRTCFDDRSADKIGRSKWLFDFFFWNGSNPLVVEFGRIRFHWWPKSIQFIDWILWVDLIKQDTMCLGSMEFDPTPTCWICFDRFGIHWWNQLNAFDCSDWTGLDSIWWRWVQLDPIWLIWVIWWFDWVVGFEWIDSISWLWFMWRSDWLDWLDSPIYALTVLFWVIRFSFVKFEPNGVTHTRLTEIDSTRPAPIRLRPIGWLWDRLHSVWRDRTRFDWIRLDQINTEINSNLTRLTYWPY